MAILYVMIGSPGMGKSTYIQSHLDENTKWISRDNVRFGMVAENEPYFSKEKDVYKEWVNEIDMWLSKGYDVYADATHLTKASRKKLLTFLKEEPDLICAVYLRGSLERSLRQNELRKGTRAYIPPEQVRKMYFSIQPPTEFEGFDEIEIINLED